jgi:adiponectin receptor
MKGSAAGIPRKLVLHDELPGWSIDNEFILRGYRAPGGINDEIKNRAGRDTQDDAAVAETRLKRRNGTASKKSGSLEVEEQIFHEHNTLHRCWTSIWLYFHNESVNIHTHFWGALLALFAMILHVLDTQDLVPAMLYPITHHSIFYPEALLATPVSPSKLSWSSLLSTANVAPSLVPLELGALITTPVTKITPWLVAHQRPNSWMDILGFATYLCGALTVLTFSATFHTVSCHSREVRGQYLVKHACSSY